MLEYNRDVMKKAINPYVIFLTFFCYAVSYNAIGTLITEVMSATGMSLENMGFLMSSVQIGIFVAIICSCLFLMRTEKALIVRSGIIFMTIALLLIIIVPGDKGLYFSFALFGFGGFFTDSGANAYLSAQSDKESRKYIPMLHFVYSLGALLSGYILMPFKGGAWRAGYGLLGILLAFLLVFSFILRKSDGNERKKEAEKAPPVKTRVILTDPIYLLLTVSMMLYMISQQVDSNWYPYYIETSFGASASLVAGTMLSFWLGIAAIRLFSSFLLSHGLSPVLLIAGGTLFSACAQLIATSVSSMSVALVFICLAGFGAGATIPCYVVEISARYRGNTFFISTFYTLLATLGRMAAQPIVASAVSSFGAASTLRAVSLLFFISAFCAIIAMKLKKSEKN